MLAVAAGTVAALVAGRRLGFPLRLFITGIILEFGYQTCLVGRTMAAGLTSATFTAAFFFFATFAILPCLSLLRLWPSRSGLTLVLGALPLSMTLALSVAFAEELWFVHRYHVTGIGPTARWTVSNHWLRYDAYTQELYGSD